MGAFFDPHALAVWWQAARSVTTPRPLGVYAIEWEPSLEPDEILGRLGGVFHGTVMEYLPGRELFVADAVNGRDYAYRLRGFSRERTVAFGDGENDVELLEWAAYGVAVANAHERVLAVADFVCPPVQDEGVAQVLEAFLDSQP